MARRARKGLATWLTSTSTPIFVLDHRRVVLVFNKGCEKLTGWAAEEVIGKACQHKNAADPTQIESLTSLLAPPEHVMHGEPAVVPAIVALEQGPHPVEIHFFPLTQEDDEETRRILGVIGPLTGSGIELVPASLLRRFELAELLATLQHKYQLSSLIARSPRMQRVLPQVQIARAHLSSIHLLGERGTGKEHVARTIHYGSSLKKSRFLPLNCQQLSHFEISRTLRKLFAEDPAETRVGTVYLKEVEHLPRDLQAELLHHLQNGSPFRWMSSSQRQLDRLDEETMSLDLSSRLTPFIIPLPPLRERREDLILLATSLLEQVTDPQRPIPLEGISAEVAHELQGYHWPGNVRELLEMLRRAAIHSSGTLLQMEDLPVSFKAGRDAQVIRPLRVQLSLDDYLADVERSRISEVLEAVRGNKSAAAEFLSIPRAKLYRRMIALQIFDQENQADTIS